MTLAYIIAALTVIAILLFKLISHWYTLPKHLTRDGFYLLESDDDKWKRVTELHYDDSNNNGLTRNILTVTTFDRNIRQFYHVPNAPTIMAWTRYPANTSITNDELIHSLNKCYSMVMRGQKRKGEGWVKVL